MNNLTLLETVQIIGEVNKHKDYSAYISNGKVIIESNIIEIKGGYNGNGTNWNNREN